MSTRRPTFCGPLREVLTGGEALSPRHVARALVELPSTTIINGYGPTESTTFATTFRVPHTFTSSSQRVPIGVPLPRTHVHVLDEHRDVQPIGVAGEIYIGGDGLGRYADAGLEQSAFVPHPFASTPGSRVYRTGDRARLLADGNVDFLGRLDRQVKIHGYRIEPGEIEAVIGRHPSVHEVAVLPVADAADERRLIACVALKPDIGANAIDSVRESCATWLPAYMVPSSFVVVPALPLSPHGKLDVRALEQLAQAAAVPSVHAEAHGAPRTPLEAVVAGVWAPILGIESPSVHDNFFDVGGHSLVALQLIHELNAAVGLDMPVRLIFTDPDDRGDRPGDWHGAHDPLRCVETLRRPRAVEAGRRPPPVLPRGRRRRRRSGTRRVCRARPLHGSAAALFRPPCARHRRAGGTARNRRGDGRGIQPRNQTRPTSRPVPRSADRAWPASWRFEMAQQLRRAGQEVRTLVLIDSFIPRWSRFMRNEIVRFWSIHVRRDLQQARAGGLLNVAREWRRRVVNPSPEEQIADPPDADHADLSGAAHFVRAQALSRTHGAAARGKHERGGGGTVALDRRRDGSRCMKSRATTTPICVITRKRRRPVLRSVWEPTTRIQPTPERGRANAPAVKSRHAPNRRPANRATGAPSGRWTRATYRIRLEPERSMRSRPAKGPVAPT